MKFRHPIDHVAYALGYYHGRATGTESNPYPFNASAKRLAYKQGYGAGIADYCDETHPEDVEKENGT